MSIKFGVIAEIHYSNGTVQSSLGNEYRQYSTADARLQDFLEVMEARGDVSFCLQIGDLIDAGTGNRATDLAAVVNRYDTDYSGTVWNSLGNHENSLFPGTVGNKFSDYWTTMDTAARPGTRENEWDPDGKGVAAYTFDSSNIRFVSMFTGFGTTASQDGASQAAWLTGVLTTSLPCVVFTHYPLGGMFPVSGYAAVQAILEAAGNVQLVINGHVHRSGITGIHPLKYEYVNDILHYHCRASVLGAEDGYSSDTATVADSAYYLFDLQHTAYLGDNQMRCNLTVTAYRKGLGKTQHTFRI